MLAGNLHKSKFLQNFQIADAPYSMQGPQTYFLVDLCPLGSDNPGIHAGRKGCSRGLSVKFL